MLADHEGWTPKGRGGRQPARARLMRLILRILGDGEHVIPRKHKTEAHDLTRDDINDFCAALPAGWKPRRLQSSQRIRRADFSPRGN